MSENGYIKLHRQLLSNPIFKKPNVLSYFIYCLLKANYKEQKIIWNKKEMVIERGCFITGRKEAAKDTGLSERSIRTVQQTLLNLGMIEKPTSKATSKFTYISVCNYSNYQEKQPASDHVTDQQATSKRPASDQQATTDKNEKNDKNDKNKEYKVFNPDSEPYKLSLLLFTKSVNNNDFSILKNLSDTQKEKTIQRWSKDIDLLIRIDKQSYINIEKIIIFVTGHEFWKNIIKSGSNLRKQWEKISSQAQNSNQYPQKKSNNLEKIDYSEFEEGRS